MNKRALLIGIDHCQYLPSYVEPLSGCVNDANALAGVLRERHGFASEDVTLLLNEQATRAAILGAIEALVEKSGDGDVAVIAYSGHGARVPDPTGRRTDGMDDALVPFDGGEGSEAAPSILDGEIHALLLRLSDRTPYVTIILDCCHAGSAIRDAFGAPVRGVPPGTVSRGPGSAPPPASWVPEGDRYVFLAACRDAESAHETRAADPTDVHGVLTFHLLRELRAAAPGASMRSVFERVSARMAVEQTWQHPHAEGALDRAVFGTTEAPATPSTALVECKGDDTTLDAGAVHGVTVGSVWAVHKADGAGETGRVRITAVHAARSEARILSGGDDMMIGDRAVEVTHVYPIPSFAVDVQAAPGLEAQAAELAPLLRDLAPAGTPPDARVYAIAPRASAGPSDPAPQLGARAAPTWAVVGRDGQLLLPAQPIEAGSFSEVFEAIQGLALVRRVAGILNDDPRSALADKVRLRLLRRGTDGAWAAAEPGPDGIVTLLEGEPVAFDIQNLGDRPVYVGLFDLDPMGEVDAMRGTDWPADNVAFNPGPPKPFGTQRPAKARVPKGYPLGAGGADGRVEAVKLFASTAETDFSLLVPGRDSYPVRPGLVAGLLRAALSGDRDGYVDPESGANEDWTTASVQLVVRPRREE